jgi:uncharacterized protein (TIGR02145 family)
VQVTLTSQAVNGGTAPAYQWKNGGVNINGATDASYSYSPVNNDALTCEMVSNVTCPDGNPAISNTLNMTVNPLQPVSVSILATATIVCEGTQVTFTASGVNGGLAPAYQWKNSGVNINGATGFTYAYIPLNNDAISCELTSGITCPTGNPAMSNTLTMAVNPYLPVSVAIATPVNPVCDGITAGFNALPVNGGADPVYLWTVNGNAIGGNGPGMSYLPGNGDVVQCQLSSSYSCVLGNPAQSNSITMEVNPSFTIAVTVEATPPGSVCSGTSVTFTATPVNGGTNPQYQWKVNGINSGSNTSTYTFPPANNDIVTCALTSNIECATGNPAQSTPFVVSIRSAPVVTYPVCHDVVTTVNAQPLRLKGGLPLGGVYSGPGVDPVAGVFNPMIAGAGIHQIKYTYTTIGLCKDSSYQTINTHPASIVNCGSSMVDIRDNKIYPTVQIGTQCWLATSLNYGSIISSQSPQVDNCMKAKYCADNQESNCVQYGALYQWDAMMCFETAIGSQGLCPPGWHVPSNSEWLTLFDFYGGQSKAGAFLQKTGTGNFNANPGGVLYMNHTLSFTPPGVAGSFFWTSDQINSTSAKSHGLNNQVNSVSDYNSSKGNGFSVRCLLD